MSILSTLKSWFRGGLAYGPVKPHVHKFEFVAKHTNTSSFGIVSSVNQYRCKSCGELYHEPVLRGRPRIIKFSDLEPYEKSPDQPSPPEGSN